MKKLQLNYDQILQGDYEVKKLNLLLVFQVNCPGCFSYALPFFNKLYDEFSSKGVSFLGLATAFEDFDKNTTENLNALLKEGTLIGETKKFMNGQGIDKLPYLLKFPVAMDSFKENTDNLDDEAEKICNIQPNYSLWPDFEKKELQERVKVYLNSLEKIALTFTLNQLKGTPSIILFNDSYEILKEWFGHVPYELVSEKVTQFN